VVLDGESSDIAPVIKVFLETITIFLGFDSFVDDAVVGEQSELAGFHIF
jgi:hypothetical protein